MRLTPHCWRRRGSRETCNSSCFQSEPCPSAACRNDSIGSFAKPPRSSTSAPIWRSAAHRSNSTARCWKNSWDRSSIFCATPLTTVSGRGVGMDVVRSDIAALGGRVDVATSSGKGTTFSLYLPLTLAVAQTVLVKAGGRLWALPAPMVEQVQQIKDKDLINLYLTREVV